MEGLPESIRSKFNTVEGGGLTETLRYFQESRKDSTGKQSADNNQVLVIIGSFGLIPEVYSFFGMQIEADPIDSNVTYAILKEGSKDPVQW